MIKKARVRYLGVFLLTILTLLVTAVSPTNTFLANAASLTKQNQQPLPPPAGQPSIDNPTLLSTFLPYERRSTGISQNLFGIESYNFIGANQVRGAESGAKFLRRNGLLWSDVEPVEGGGYNWNAPSIKAMEFDLFNANVSGMSVILIVRGTTSWAQQYPGIACGPIKQSKLPNFGNFMKALVQRYSIPPYNVKYYQIWNEPDVDKDYVDPNNIYGWWGDEADPFYAIIL